MRPPRRVFPGFPAVVASEFEQADSITQASFAHYTFVRIHPFADGNGRVARALASVYLLRASSIPLIVFHDDRDAYLAALRDADAGDLAQFMRLVRDLCVEGVRLVQDFFDRRDRPGGDTLAELYVTASGHTLDELDKLAFRLLEMFQDEFDRHVEQREDDFLEYEIERRDRGWKPESQDYRKPVEAEATTLCVRFSSKPPVSARVSEHLDFWVPRKADLPLMIVPRGSTDAYLEVDPDELTRMTGALRARVRLAAARVFDSLYERLVEAVRTVKNENGY